MRRIDVAEVEHRQLLDRPAYGIHGRIDAVAKLGSSIPHAELQHAPVANDDDVGDFARYAGSEEPRADLRADAGRVSEHQADHGLVHQRFLARSRVRPRMLLSFSSSN